VPGSGHRANVVRIQQLHADLRDFYLARKVW
jgi:hypothetical protein